VLLRLILIYSTPWRSASPPATHFIGPYEIYRGLSSIYGILSSTGGSPPFKADTFTTNGNEPYLDFISYALEQDSFAQVLSTSYGDDEQTVRFTR
jgi:hypothetical protein